MTRLMACGAVLALAGAAMAQDRPPPPPRGDAPPALRGPKVQEDRVPGMDGSFGEGRPDGRMGGGRVPPGALMAAIGKLRGENAPDGLRLTEKQEDKFRALHDEMGAMRPGGPRAGAPRDGKPSEDEKAQRRQMGERVQEVQTRAFAILTPEQKDFVKAELAKATKEADGRQGEMRLQRKLKERDAGQPPAPPPPPQGEGRPGQPPQQGQAWWQRDGAGPAGPQGGQRGPEGAPVPRERLRHIAELLGQLSPEEREQFLTRIERALEERARRGGQDEDAPRARRPQPEEKEDADEVEVRPRRARPDQPPPAEQSEQPRPRRNPPG